MERFYDNVKHGIEVQGDKNMPVIESKLRKRSVAIPDEIRRASGIKIFNKRIKSILFSRPCESLKCISPLSQMIKSPSLAVKVWSITLISAEPDLI